jgi:hypothetical protein
MGCFTISKSNNSDYRTVDERICDRLCSLTTIASPLVDKLVREYMHTLKGLQVYLQMSVFLAAQGLVNGSRGSLTGISTTLLVLFEQV